MIEKEGNTKYINKYDCINYIEYKYSIKLNTIRIIVGVVLSYSVI